MKKYNVLYAFVLMLIFAGSVLGQVTVTGGSGAGNYTALSAALDAIGTASGDYTVSITANQDLGPRVIAPGQNITLASGNSGAYNVRLSSAGALFTISASSSLTLQNGVTLIGRPNHIRPVVYVESSGIFNMRGGKITGNDVSNPNAAGGAYRAGGVGVEGGGTFNMYGGEISGNSLYGVAGPVGGAGGVLMSGGVFNMYGGTISGNKNSVEAASIGNGAGGVYISDGIFNIYGGALISQNEQTGALARAAGGVYLANTSRFEMSGGTIKENKSMTSPSGNGDGVFVIGTSNVYFSGSPRIEDGIFTGAALASGLRIDGPLSSNALITVQGSGAAGQMTPNVNVTGAFSGVTEEMANAFVSKDLVSGSPRLVGTVAGNRVMWAENFDITLNIAGNMNFGSAAYGYTTLQSVDIGNRIIVSNSKRATGRLTITLSGVNAGAFELSQTTIGNIEMDDQDDFFIKTKRGLPAGNYTAVVTVEGRYVRRSFDIQFEVMKTLLIVSAAGVKTVYGEEPPRFTAVYSGFVNSETPAVLSGVLGFEYIGNSYSTGSSAGNYTIRPFGLSSDNYNIQYMPNMLTVEKRAALIEVAVSDKIYDGNKFADVSAMAIVSNKYSTDDVTAAAGTAEFIDKNVGNNKVVVFDGWSLGGAKANNYFLLRQPAAAANITPKEISVNSNDIVYNGKVYDGTTDGPPPGMIPLGNNPGVISGDVLSASYTSALYDDKNAGTERKVTFSGLALRGLDAGNYILSSQTVIKNDAVISKRPLLLKADDKLIYVNDDEPEYTYMLMGLVQNETRAVITAAPSYVLAPDNFNSSTPGTYGIQPSGAAAANYDIQYENGILTVSGKSELSSEIVFAGDVFEYDGSPQTPAVTYNGSGDNFTYSYAGVNDTGGTYIDGLPPVDVGSYIITAMYEDGSHIGKAMSAFTITPKPLTISGAVHTKEYDGARSASGVAVTLSGIVGSDDVSPDAVTAMYNGSNAGTTEINITSVKLTGADFANYTVNLPAMVSVAGITRKNITREMFAIVPQTYTGSELEPMPLAFDGGNPVTFSIDSYSNNINPGAQTALVTVSGTGNYTGTLTLNFSIIENSDGRGAEDGIGTVSIDNWIYGSPPSTPELFSPTNGINNVSVEYKLRGADNDDYTAEVPRDAGEYTVRAVFAAAELYPMCSDTVDFTIFKAQQTRPCIPGIEANVSGTVLSGLPILPDGVEGIAADRSRLETIGIEVVVTTASIDLQMKSSAPEETARWQYCVNGGSQWQDNPNFGGLEPNGEYALLIRKKWDKNHFPSPAAAILIRTLAVGPEVITNNVPEGNSQPLILSKNSGNGGYSILLENRVVSGRVEFTVKAPDKSIANVVIYDRLGNVVFRKSGVKSNEPVTWDLISSGRKVANGSYLIVAVSRDDKGKAHRCSTIFGVRKQGRI